MRNISLIFIGLLVIFYMAGQTAVHAELTTTIIGSLIKWGPTLINKLSKVKHNKGDDIKQTLAKTDELSNELEQFGTQMDIKLDIMLNTLLNDIELTVELQDLKTQLVHHLHTVDYYHKMSLKYSPGKYANRTLQGFINNVMYGNENLPSILVRMHDIFDPGAHAHLSPGFLSLIVHKAEQNLPTDCQRYITPHQLMYYIYVQLMIAEMKAIVTLDKVYTLKSWLENSRFDYKTELEEAHTNFERGVQKFHQEFTKQFPRLPRHLRRCHINKPQRGVDFFELKGLSRAKLITPDNNKQRRCNCCLSPEPSYMEYGMEMKVHNCKRLSRYVKACPVENGLLNEYSWWSDDSGTYGKNKTCSKPETVSAGESVSSVPAVYTLPHIKECNNWYCTVEKNIKGRKDYNSWRISVKPQVADIWNDMVVIGVQFIVKDRTIHLQIQQGKFSNNGLVYNDIAWKDVHKSYNVSGVFVPPIVDERLGTHQKTIYLDDITVPKDSVVTGVQLMRVRKRNFFRLWVLATVFDLATGKLDPSQSFWCSRHVCKQETPTGDHIRHRIEIDMGEADNPTKGTGFNYDPHSNKMVTFTHTDAHKDAGQTTIPFIDLQPVRVQPAFPLSGVGLYYRGKEGFGGYIAPRIYTFDVTQHI